MWAAGMIEVSPSAMRALLLLVASFTASSETFTGYVVDNYCWNMAEHRGVDGSQLAKAPGTHWLHCLWDVAPCEAQGYLLLEELGAPRVPEGYAYGARYQLDAQGDELVYELTKAEQQRGGDRRFDEQFAIKGTVAGDEIAVTEVCLTPSANNPSNQTFCRRASTTVAPTAAPLLTAAPTPAPPAAPATPAPPSAPPLTFAPTSSPLTLAPTTAPAPTPTAAPPTAAPTAAPPTAAPTASVMESDALTDVADRVAWGSLSVAICAAATATCDL